MAEITKPTSKNNIKRILEVLSRHSELISEALIGNVEIPIDTSSAAIDALVGVNALMPFDEGCYQLNPRLRIFLSEQLANFSAFQTLTRISEQIYGIKSKWREIVLIKESGDWRDLDVLVESLGYTVNEIVHFTTQNLLLLNTQIGTDFGNVTTLRAKLRQNTFYAEGVKTLQHELRQLDAFTMEIDRDALGKGIGGVRRVVNNRIRSRLPDWMGKLNDIQATISKRLFIAKKIENELLYLAKTVLWMAQNPTRNGFDIDVSEPEKIDLSLFRPVPIRVRPQTDVSQIAPASHEVLALAVRRMPSVANIKAETKPTRQLVIHQEMAEIEIEPALEDKLIQSLVESLDQPDASPIYLLNWHPQERHKAGLDDEAWLLYAANQCSLQGLQTQFCTAPRMPGDLNDFFDNVIVFPAIC